MPVLFGVTVSSASYADPNLTVAGDGFGDERYPVSSVEVSLDGVTWTPVTIILWANDSISGTIASLPAGTYQVRVRSSDNVLSDPLLAAFTVAAASGGTARLRRRHIWGWAFA